MIIKLVHEKLVTFFDCILENYIENNNEFLLNIWADMQCLNF
jgi:hypothetical protein